VLSILFRTCCPPLAPRDRPITNFILPNRAKTARRSCWVRRPTLRGMRGFRPGHPSPSEPAPRSIGWSNRTMCPVLVDTPSARGWSRRSGPREWNEQRFLTLQYASRLRGKGQGAPVVIGARSLLARHAMVLNGGQGPRASRAGTIAPPPAVYARPRSRTSFRSAWRSFSASPGAGARISPESAGLGLTNAFCNQKAAPAWRGWR